MIVEFESHPPYQWIEVTGPISMEPAKRKVPAGSYIILIMGLTGVGKSNFIESFSSTPPKARISGNGCDSVTQCLTAYKLVNIKFLDDHPIFLIDTPGFSDRKLSEKNIMQQIQNWMRANDIEVINHIIYLDRITDTRVGGTKGKIFDMFKLITGSDTANNITVLTTMWDECIRPDQKAQAEGRFQQLRNQHWKEFIQNGARILKFENSQTSALLALDQCLLHSIRKHFDFAQDANAGKDLSQSKFAESIGRIMMDRITPLYLERADIDEQLAKEGSPTPSDSNKKVMQILLERKQVIEHDLFQFAQELRECGCHEDFMKEKWPNLPVAPPVLKKGIFQRLKCCIKRVFRA